MPLPISPKSAPLFASRAAKGSSSPSTAFALKLFRELMDGAETNLFFSPLSVMLCALLIHEAAARETRREIAKALEIADLDAVDAQLTIMGLKGPFGWHRRVEIMGSNSLWCNHSVQCRAEFAAKLREIYDAEIVTLDFGAADAIQRVNEWVRQKTNGKVGELLDDLPPQAAVIALNAIYFKGLWITPFQRSFTIEGPFTTAKGEVKYLPMMRQSGSYSYYQDQDLQAVVLPYGDNMAMYVLLPMVRTGTQQLRERLTWGTSVWGSTRFRMAEGLIQIPRFKLDCRVQLEAALKNLGMGRAFDPSRAEFEGLRTDQGPLWIARILHRAVAEVNEEGTVAAAATDITGYLGVEKQLPLAHFDMTQQS